MAVSGVVPFFDYSPTKTGTGTPTVVTGAGLPAGVGLVDG